MRKCGDHVRSGQVEAVSFTKGLPLLIMQLQGPVANGLKECMAEITSHFIAGSKQLEEGLLANRACPTGLPAMMREALAAEEGKGTMEVEAVTSVGKRSLSLDDAQDWNNHPLVKALKTAARDENEVVVLRMQVQQFAGEAREAREALAEMKKEFTSMREEYKQEMAKIKEEYKQELAQQKADLTQKMKDEIAKNTKENEEKMDQVRGDPVQIMEVVESITPSVNFTENDIKEIGKKVKEEYKKIYGIYPPYGKKTYPNGNSFHTYLYYKKDWGIIEKVAWRHFKKIIKY